MSDHSLHGQRSPLLVRSEEMKEKVLRDGVIHESTHGVLGGRLGPGGYSLGSEELAGAAVGREEGLSSRAQCEQHDTERPQIDRRAGGHEIVRQWRERVGFLGPVSPQLAVALDDVRLSRLGMGPRLNDVPIDDDTLDLRHRIPVRLVHGELRGSQLCKHLRRKGGLIEAGDAAGTYLSHVRRSPARGTGEGEIGQDGTVTLVLSGVFDDVVHADVAVNDSFNVHVPQSPSDLQAGLLDTGEVVDRSTPELRPEVQFG
mmetsp:Transcript_53914/g.161330  ORF Transcript_53914/g.161330 Transcript_53914/m.161330 type:complete len:258 (-) Transcript_53914:4970-5743(-)